MKLLLRCLPLLLMVTDALALRCGVWLVEPGQSVYEVGQKCGDPDSSERRSEWRVQTVLQQQCQSIPEPVYQPPAAGPQGQAGQPSVNYRTFCTAVPISFSVPVDVEIWYYDDPSVPKALHFETGRLVWIEPLWRLRH